MQGSLVAAPPSRRLRIDLGSLAVGGKLAQFPGGPLPNQNLVKVG
jgi:hypothetical protein